jgi:hypothetical protein
MCTRIAYIRQHSTAPYFFVKYALFFSLALLSSALAPSHFFFNCKNWSAKQNTWSAKHVSAPEAHFHSECRAQLHRHAAVRFVRPVRWG